MFSDEIALENKWSL